MVLAGHSDIHAMTLVYIPNECAVFELHTVFCSHMANRRGNASL